MSAEGRGARGIELDNYPTPSWCVRRMLEAAPWNAEGAATRPILEPCAGEGAIVRELKKAYPSSELCAWELRDTRAALYSAGANLTWIGDALASGTHWPAIEYGMGLCLTNPPFTLWHEFAKRAVACSRWTALLLRIGALAHCRRHGLPTPSLYVLPDRPSFVALWKCAGGGRVRREQEDTRFLTNAPCGWQEYRDPNESTRGQRCPDCGGKISRTASDGSEYAWFVWGPQAPKVHILASTPLAERKGWRPAEAA